MARKPKSNGALPDGAKLNPDASIAVSLKHPIKLSPTAQGIATITVTGPVRVKHIMAGEEAGSDVERALLVATAMSNVPVEVMRELELDDWRVMEEVVTRFLAPTPTQETGKTR